MGTVYVARDRVLNREVAVKVLDVADQRGLARGAADARSAHPGAGSIIPASCRCTTPGCCPTAGRFT